jgi:hypothetical protein
MFAITSRYYGLPIAQWQTTDGRTVAYVTRRFLPPPDRLALLQEHVVGPGQRLDHIAAQYLGDPEQFWRIADGNTVMAPEELTDRPGARLRITLPAGVPGTTND